MSEFKYVCPWCGQHIRCDSTHSGSVMDCPTCFQKIIAPPAPVGHDTRLVLAGIKISSQPRKVSPPGVETTPAPSPAKNIPVLAIVVVAVVVALVLAAVAAVLLFRGKISKPANPPVAAQKVETTRPNLPPSAPPVVASPVNDPNWKLELDGVVLADAPATGRLNGKEFTNQRATLLGGSLSLRQGSQWPPELGVVIGLHALRSADLAGKTIGVATNLPSPPKIVLRWKDAQQQSATRNFNDGYALRIEFGPLTDGKLPGKIYLCLPDEQKSYVAGSFTAEIIKPKPTAKPPKRKP
jgi:DNA-directed RNA polymerase subunit RPC12/RpoP